MEEEPLTKEPTTPQENYQSTDAAENKDDEKKESKTKDGDGSVEGTRVDLVPAIILSCISFWLCGILFGGIAFILAMVGKHKSDAGDQTTAGQLRISSYVLSAVGIALGTAVIVVVFIVGYVAKDGPIHG